MPPHTGGSGQRRAVAVVLRVVGGGERGQRLFHAGEIGEEIIEAAVLGVDHDQGLDLVAQQPGGVGRCRRSRRRRGLVVVIVIAGATTQRAQRGGAGAERGDAGQEAAARGRICSGGSPWTSSGGVAAGCSFSDMSDLAWNAAHCHCVAGRRMTAGIVDGPQARDAMFSGCDRLLSGGCQAACAPAVREWRGMEKPPRGQGKTMRKKSAARASRLSRRWSSDASGSCQQAARRDAALLCARLPHGMSAGFKRAPASNAAPPAPAAPRPRRPAPPVAGPRAVRPRSLAGRLMAGRPSTFHGLVRPSSVSRTPALPDH